MQCGNTQRIPVQVSRDCVVASVQNDLDHDVLQRFQTDLLELLTSSGAKGVIIDLSGVEVMDLVDFEALRRTINMASLMGAYTVLSGLQAGVVSSLVELDAPVDDIIAAQNLDEAFVLVARSRDSEAIDAGGGAER